MKELWREYRAAYIITGICIVIVIASVFVQAKMESATFNKLTGSKTTWWDAMWVELRVMEVPKENR